LRGKQIVGEVQVYLLVDLYYDCYANNNFKFQKLLVVLNLI